MLNRNKVSSLLKSTISLFLFIMVFTGYGQTWQYRISHDFEFSVQDKWGESGTYEAKFVVANPRLAFVKEIIIKDDQWGSLIFPDEFIQTRGQFDRDTITAFEWYIQVKNKKVAEGKIDYDPSPNTFLQLNKFDPYPIKHQLDIWGEVMDAYSWTDKKGKNLFIRSVLQRTQSTYLYAYHFIERDEEVQLVRKITDHMSNCNADLIAEHLFESVELTDVNRDTIGEISFCYKVDCLEKIEPEVTKLMLLNEGKKYALRGKSEVCINKDDGTEEFKGGEFVAGKELNNEPVLYRFMEKKWNETIKHID